MLVLLIFSFISGLVTILAPCIWPLLPIILSSSASGGKRKPLGITLGIMFSFAVFTLSISYVVKLLNLDPNVLRLVAVVVIGFLGLSLVVPSISARIEVFVSRFSGNVGDKKTQRSGFLGGLITGFSLGIVWSPCAGPILATIATLAITASVSWQVILVTITYVCGVGIPLFFLSQLSSSIFARTRSISKHTGKIQQVFGVIMILTAVAIYTNFDRTLQVKLLEVFPQYSNYLTQLESNPEVTKQLQKLKGNKIIVKKMEGKAVSATGNSSTLPDYGLAPEFAGISKWLNSDPVSMSDLRGKIVLVDFWTYTCINCIRTLPYVTSWFDKYHDKGFVVIGVHTPEFEFEKNSQNVLNAIKQFAIKYPVAQDNDYQTWNAFNNQYWPAEYLIDAKGHIREMRFGEGNYAETEKNIQELLTEAGTQTDDKIIADKIAEQTPAGRISPESYIGAKRMEFLYPSGTASLGQKDFVLEDNPPINSFSFGGNWTIGNEYSMPSGGASLTYHFRAKKVHLVMRPMKGPVQVRLSLDGQPNKIITVDEDKLYTLIQLSDNEEHVLKIEFVDGGVSVYAFTFG